MSTKLFRSTLSIVFSIWLLQSIPGAGLAAVSAGEQAGDQKYAGQWAGSYKTESGQSGDLFYDLSKDEKGQWRGTVKYTNESGEQKSDFASLQIADGKFKGKIESPDGQVEVTIEGQIQGDKFEGTYTVAPKGSSESVEKGTWTVSRSAAGKAGQ